MGECASCGDTKHETARSVVLDAELCLACYEDKTEPALPDHLHGCPSCGTRGDARYGSERICWPCYVERHKLTTPALRRPKRSRYARKVDLVWARLEEQGTVFILPDGSMAGWCPACGRGTTKIWVLGADDQPRLRVESCSAGCTEDDIAKVLR